MKSKGFTLLELLIVIAIIGILAVLGFSNYMNALKSGKDARRKVDLQTIQKALETYYQDNQVFPLPDAGSAVPTSGNSFCHPDGCDVETYLEKLPKDPSGGNYVYVSTDQTSYQLYSCIENVNDNGPGVKQGGYGISCGVNQCDPCKYGVSSTNTTP